MANKTKANGMKREMDVSSSEESSSDSEANSDEEMECREEDINIEFEAQTPVETDFHGIKQLLMRLFVLFHMDLSELTDLFLSQTNVGSTIKVVDDEEDEIYGINSVISLKKHEDKACVKELKKNILTKCKGVASDDSQKLEAIFDKYNVGFVINERFINIPPQIALPFHKSLRAEVDEAASEDTTFNFDYLLLISKTLQETSVPGNDAAPGGSKKKGKKKKAKKEGMGTDEVEYTNFEEELFHKASEVSFSYNVTEATGLAIGGKWDFGDQLMKTYRTVMLVPVAKWNGIIAGMEQALGG